ncbi:MAG: FkbM family methyltransferase [Acidobacteriota bacterium]|nr:FkbM family methyltransferase [Acidobacteriota bacterium]
MQNDLDKSFGNRASSARLLRLVRFYTFYFPVNRGKGRIFNLAKRFSQPLPQNVVTETRDGRRFCVNFRDWADDRIYFLGDYETFCTETVKKYIKKGDICLDAGANIGWYSTLFRKIVGANGAVHSFEPVPQTFAGLKKNIALNGAPPNVFLNNFGLGDAEKTLEIYLFDNLPSGHASLTAREDQPAQAIPVQIKTLDSYLTERKINQVDFVKVDIEGAEMMFLRGGKKLFEQKTPPVIFMEMALETARVFGYKPNDLIVFLREKADYKFYALDEKNEKLLEIDGFPDDDIGANVLCIPQK